MIEVRVANVFDNGADEGGVMFVFDNPASDADLALLQKALVDLGAVTARVGKRPAAALANHGDGDVVTCKVCNGHGKAYGADPNKPCEACGGAGKVRLRST